MITAAVAGGIILGMIEGVSVVISRATGQMALNEQCKLKIELKFFLYSFIKILYIKRNII